MWNRFYECDCCGSPHVLMLSNETDYDDLLYLAFFQNSIRNNYGWKERLRWTWHMFCTGEPYGDQMCLDRDTARALANDLLKFVNKEIK